jgi:SPP1 family predicted phage head-tail adaptor
MLNSGEFREIIDILEVTITQNAALSDVKSLTKIATVHAQVNSYYKREDTLPGQEDEEIDIIFTVRYSAAYGDILKRKQDFRAQYMCVVYKIKYADDFKYRHETIKLSCKAVTRYGKRERTPEQEP